jgi:hypothetical protein
MALKMSIKRILTFAYAEDKQITAMNFVIIKEGGNSDDL